MPPTCAGLVKPERSQEEGQGQEGGEEIGGAAAPSQPQSALLPGSPLFSSPLPVPPQESRAPSLAWHTEQPLTTCRAGRAVPNSLSPLQQPKGKRPLPRSGSVSPAQDWAMNWL